MDLNANKRTAKALITAIGENRLDDASALMTDDGTWWTSGTTAVSGLKPKAAHFEGLGHGMKFAELPGRFEFGEITAEDNRVCVEAQIFLKLKNGRLYNNRYHYLFTFRDGKIANAKEYMDTDHVIKILLTP